MKNAFLFLCLAVTALGSPVKQIFSYVSENGNQIHEASGEAGVDVQGRAMWDAEGNTFAFTYTANDQGYVADDSETKHFPVPVVDNYLPYDDDVAKARAEHMAAREQILTNLAAAAAKLERRRRDTADEENVVFSYSDPETQQSHYMNGIPGVDVTGGWTFTPEDMEYKLAYRANADVGFYPEANYLPLPVKKSYLPNTPEVDAYIADWENHFPKPVEKSFLPNTPEVDAYIADWGNHIPVSVARSYLPYEPQVTEARAAHLRAWADANSRHMKALEAAEAQASEEDVVERKKRHIVYYPHYLMPVPSRVKKIEAVVPEDPEAAPAPEPLTPGDTRILDITNSANQVPGVVPQLVRLPVYQAPLYYPRLYNPWRFLLAQSPVNIGVPENDKEAELVPAPASFDAKVQAAEEF